MKDLTRRTALRPRPLVPAYRRPLLRSLVTGRPAPIRAVR